MVQPTKLSALLVAGQFFEGIAPTVNVNTAGAVSPIPNANVLNAIYNRDCNGAIRTDTTDTAANIIAAIRVGAVAPVLNTAFIWYVRNVSGGAYTLTIAGGTGVTIVGTATIAQNAVRTFVGVVTDPKAKTISLYSLGSQAF